MPKLNDLQVYERLFERLEQLKRGEKIETRTLRKLLTDEQLTTLKSAVVTGKSNGKNITEIQKEFVQKIVDDLFADMDNIFERLQHKAEVKRAKIFLKAYCGAKENKNPLTEANNALTRSGFRRMDAMKVTDPMHPRNKPLRSKK